MMDLIDRQDAIDILCKRLIETANNNVGYTCDAGQTFEDASERIKYWIDEVPSAQPEQAVKDCRNCKHGKYNDHLETHFCYNPNECTEWNLWKPTAQPDHTMRCNFCDMSICTLEGRPCSRKVVKET